MSQKTSHRLNYATTETIYPQLQEYSVARERLYGPLRSSGLFGWDQMYGEEYALACMHYITPAFREELAAATRSMSGIMTRMSQAVLQGGDDLLREIGIPEQALSAVRVGLKAHYATIIGRFDFVHTSKGLRMIEFNSDTPTSIVEAFEVNGFACLAAGATNPNEGMATKLAYALQDAVTEYERQGYATQAIVFSSLGEHKEDKGTTEYLLRQLQRHSERIGEFVALEDLRVYEDRLCVLLQDGTHKPIDVLYRLHAIEKLAEEKDASDDYPTGAHVLDLLARRRLASINPPSALICQTKALQALIWSLHEAGEFFTEEEHQDIARYMLPTYLHNHFADTNSYNNSGYVSKPIFGREGGAVTLYDDAGEVMEKDGEDEYWEQLMVYQERVELPVIEVETARGVQQGHLLWGSFCIAGEPSAIVARVGGRITGNMAYYLPVGLKG